jgi:hypothetical protein
MAGFIEWRGPQRVPIRNDQGQKTGYLASVDGQQLFQSPDGRTIVRIIRFKQPPIRMGAQGGCFVPTDF